MKHEAIKAACEAAGLTVRQVPASNRRSYHAQGEGHAPIVYWSTSTEGGMLGLPRVITRDGHDTHARTLKEITYLCKS